jgi:hypothetical protein
VSAVSSTALRTGLALAALSPCCLCDDPCIAVTAFFVPADDCRITFYALCSSCFAHDNAPDLVEAELRDAA